MKHLGTIRIETERLILRKCQVSDYKESFLYCCSNPELARLQNFDVHENDKVTKKSFIEKEEQYKKDDSFYEWAIINKETNTFMGEIALVNYDEETNSFETGYHLGKPFRGKGYMTEAVCQLCDYVFTTSTIVRISAESFAKNHSSCRVLEKAGFSGSPGSYRHQYS